MLVALQVLLVIQHLGWRFGERRELVGSQFDHLARALQPCLVRGRHAGPEARAADRADLTVELGTRDHAADDVLACWQEVCHRSDGEVRRTWATSRSKMFCQHSAFGLSFANYRGQAIKAAINSFCFTEVSDRQQAL